MIAEAIQVATGGDRVTRASQLRWRDGAAQLWIDVPAELAAEEDDASALLPACLLPAMRRHEDLEIDGSVSPRGLHGSETAQAAFHAWDLSIRRARVAVGARGAPRRRQGRRSGCFFSRGVDSMHAAVLARAAGSAPVLIFCQRLDPIQGPATREAERTQAARAAGELGLPLAVTETNLRTITDPLMDWGDMHGGGLGFIALSLAGGLERVIVPSTHSEQTVGPWGSSPYVDPLWSTESVEVDHGRLGSRAAKLAVIAEHAPTLLPLIKVCYRTDGPDNCGRCNKCLLTMVALETLDLPDAAAAFPARLDPKRVAALRPGNYASRLFWVEAHRSLSPERRHRELRRAIERLLRGVARPGPVERLRRRELRGRPRSRVAGASAATAPTPPSRCSWRESPTPDRVEAATGPCRVDATSRRSRSL